MDPYAIYGYYGGNEEPYDVVIPSNVKEIASCAFEDCKCLRSVEIPDSVTRIGADAFAGQSYSNQFAVFTLLYGVSSLAQLQGRNVRRIR